MSCGLSSGRCRGENREGREPHGTQSPFNIILWFAAFERDKIQSENQRNQNLKKGQTHLKLDTTYLTLEQHLQNLFNLNSM